MEQKPDKNLKGISGLPPPPMLDIPVELYVGCLLCHRRTFILPCIRDNHIHIQGLLLRHPQTFDD
jgi:hypothetical protein